MKTKTKAPPSTSSKPLQIIEPSVVRLTSDETRMLMKAAVNPKGIPLDHHASGCVALGLIVVTKAQADEKSSLKRKMLLAQAACLHNHTSWKALQKSLEVHREAKRAYDYYNKPQELYTLTAAGKALVKSITIRRR